MEKVFYCVDCKEPFKSKSYRAERCPKCRQERQRLLKRENYIRKKERKYGENSLKTIREIMRELKAYNQEHNTHLSYGQYVSQIEGRQANDRYRKIKKV